jgi:hypothetical protein
MRPALEVADISAATAKRSVPHRAIGSAAATAASWPPFRPTVPQRSAAMSNAAMTAARFASPTTVVATSTARSARAWHAPSGLRIVRLTFCRSPISTSSSLCRPPVAAIALQNKAIVYDILLKAAAETIRVIAGNPQHLGGETGMIAILHTWGQTPTHHPQAHCVVPGSGLASDERWIGCRPNFFLPVHVLSRLYRHLFLERLQATFDRQELVLSGNRSSSQGATQCRMGRVCQAPLRRAGAGVFGALHPSCRDRQQPASCLGKRSREFPLEGLSLQ